MVHSDCFVSLIAPLYNDGLIVESFVEEVIDILQKNYGFYELVLINDGSDDNTAEKVCLLLKKYSGIRLISLSRHFGTEIAISSGLDSVIGDFIVVMLPRSDPPQLISELVQSCRKGNDILIGVRKNRSGEPLWMRIGSGLFYWFCKHLLKIPFTKNATHFRVFSRKIVNAITQIQDKYCYLRLISAYVGYKSEIFTYEPIRRYKKFKSRSLLASINLGLQIIFMNSVHPLRIASNLSILASLFNLSYILYIVLIYCFKKKVVEGWVTLSMQNAIMFFLISVILAILCEYVGLMFVKLRGWAPYYVADEKNSSVLIPGEKMPNIVNDSQDIKF